ncbi:uncharacterized protein MONBRDRAFT_38851 [Monosiga brevicollis MX1]|uniref:BED-type domain-containing protein n=1 Tax=Monosiga brevicollis TaxID=81824 RepID=A9VAI9_MONBE|nr:uncharacterized protein MONBRDRAFT_38851 [Monosiga brevicollis MX1]EDQ85549.1 predicted protein [Monosiga brevicollis MX1]|eukprot:XP_001749740.1 hypothetical protein [Monosiga brevicollis MX1]
MGRKKRKSKADEPINVIWCYYCEREFDNEEVLIQHQKAKHFKCHLCSRKLYTASGLVVHCMQVHKEDVKEVPNSLPGREDPELEVFGIAGIPAQLQQQKNAERLAKRAKESAEEAAGVPPPPPTGAGAPPPPPPGATGYPMGPGGGPPPPPASGAGYPPPPGAPPMPYPGAPYGAPMPPPGMYGPPPGAYPGPHYGGPPPPGMYPGGPPFGGPRPPYGAPYGPPGGGYPMPPGPPGARMPPMPPPVSGYAPPPGSGAPPVASSGPPSAPPASYAPGPTSASSGPPIPPPQHQQPPPPPQQQQQQPPPQQQQQAQPPQAQPQQQAPPPLPSGPGQTTPVASTTPANGVAGVRTTASTGSVLQHVNHPYQWLTLPVRFCMTTQSFILVGESKIQHPDSELSLPSMFRSEVPTCWFFRLRRKPTNFALAKSLHFGYDLKGVMRTSDKCRHIKTEAKKSRDVGRSLSTSRAGEQVKKGAQKTSLHTECCQSS